MRFTDVFGQLELIVYHFAVDFRVEPFGAQPGLRLLARPFGTLVGEVKRIVVMDGQNDVVVVRNFQLGKSTQSAPFGRANQYRAVGIGFPDDRQHFRYPGIPEFRSQVAIGLVQRFKQQAVGVILKKLADLSPLCHEPLSLSCRVGEQ